jgi:queuosine precursor transporter
MGFFGIVFAAVATQIVVAIPPADFWIDQQEAFASTFQLVGRLAAAGVIAYIASQSFDVWAFHWWRKKTKNKKLWLRNNASTWVSQLIDTALFITIAFYDTLPLVTFFALIVGQYIMKVVIAALDTPIVYWLRSWIGVPQEVIAAHQTDEVSAKQTQF